MTLIKNKLAMAVAGVVLAAAPALAHANDHGRRPDWQHESHDRDEHHDWDHGRDHDSNVSVGIRIGDNDPRPAYEDRTTRVWVEPVYRTVCDRVWHEAVTRDECTRVWVPDCFEERTIVERRYGHRIERRERVLVEPGHWTEQHRTVVVSEGYWENVERQELVSAGHWEYRTDRVPVVVDRGDRYEQPNRVSWFFGFNTR